jgi:hypothetical protein
VWFHDDGDLLREDVGFSVETRTLNTEGYLKASRSAKSEKVVGSLKTGAFLTTWISGGNAGFVTGVVEKLQAGASTLESLRLADIPGMTTGPRCPISFCCTNKKRGFFFGGRDRAQSDPVAMIVAVSRIARIRASNPPG